MVSPPWTNGSAGARVSTVVPGTARGEAEDRPLSGLDLAFKLHYVKGLYVFEAAAAVAIRDLKEPMFALLDRFFPAAGRIRLSGDGDGRPYLKCNDAGVRIVEAFCDATVDEWLSKLKGNSVDDMVMEEDFGFAGLCYGQALGPDLGFSPLVYVQFTWFKCGGLSVGLSWAHLLGGVSSASAFINTWAQIMAGHVPKDPIHVPYCEKTQDPTCLVLAEKALSLKEVESVGNHWLLTANNHGRKMITHSFMVTSKQLELLRSNTFGEKPCSFSGFEILSAVIWKSLSRIRDSAGPKIVTVCRYGHSGGKSVILSTVAADLDTDVDASELAFQIANRGTVENDAIEDVVARKNGKVDFFVYGANLTLVDLENVDIYGLELRGEKPIFANHTISGVGDEGLVLVQPSGPNRDEDEVANGRTVTMVLPEDQLVRLKNDLKNQWNID